MSQCIQGEYITSCGQSICSGSILVIFRTNLPECHIRFYSLSALKTDTVLPHPAATLPFIRLPIQDSAILQNVFQLQIFGDYVILEIRVDIGPISTHFIDIYSWKTGQLISVRISTSLHSTNKCNP